jgi:hypothetical protein
MVHPHQTEVCIRRVQVQIPQFPLRERRYVTSIHCVVSLLVRSQPDRFDTVEGLPSRSAILKGRRLTLPPCNRPPYIPMSPDLLRTHEAAGSTLIFVPTLCLTMPSLSPNRQRLSPLPGLLLLHRRNDYGCAASMLSSSCKPDAIAILALDLHFF